jgi:hypothetical protein
MKKSFLMICLAIITVVGAQAQEFPKPDASPLDMARQIIRNDFFIFV